MLKKLSICGLLLFALVILGAGPCYAQQDPGTMEKRLELAEKMHEIRPARGQVEAAVEQLANGLPEDRQQMFRTRIMQVFDIQALEQSSVEAMAEVFTTAELEKMIDYFGSEEGRRISEKMVIYQELVRPDLVRLLDEALITIRTGDSGDGQ